MTAAVRLFVVITASRSHIKDDIIENLGGFGTSFTIFESVDDSFIRLNALYAFRNLSDRGKIFIYHTHFRLTSVFQLTNHWLMEPVEIICLMNN